MAINKEVEARLLAIENELKRAKNKEEYFIQKEYLVKGKHAGWITLVPGEIEDFYIIIGDDEKDLLEGPLTKEDKKALNTKPAIGNSNDNKHIEPTVTKSNKSKPKPEPIMPKQETEAARTKRIRDTAIAIEKDFPDTTEYTW